MFTLLRNADVYAPEPLGRRDVLVASHQIAAISEPGEALPDLPASYGADIVDLDGAILAPGPVDLHVHLGGGGGEAGPASRVPPLCLGDFARAGVTTCVGLLGTDGTTRTMRDLVARVFALRDAGLSAWCWTGSYELPLVTLTGSVRADLCFVEPILGVGELAISDRRSSQPTFDELVRLASECYVGGMLAGKPGLLHLHLGDGPRGLLLVRRAIDETELPARVFFPTHVNRRRALFDEAVALALRGVPIDVTAFPVEDGEDAYSAEEAIARALAAGVKPELVTCSSDAGGSLPVFDAGGQLAGMDVGRPDALGGALRGLVERGMDLGAALSAFTASPADRLGLVRKGHVRVGGDADLVVFDAAPEGLGRVRDVMARGRFVVRDGEQRVFGRFEATKA